MVRIDDGDDGSDFGISPRTRAVATGRLGAMCTIRKAGLRVPQDISVIDIDDHPVAELVGLTTVRQSVRDQGMRAAHLLLALLHGQHPDPAQTLPTWVVVRATTSAVPEQASSPPRPAPGVTTQ